MSIRSLAMSFALGLASFSGNAETVIASASTRVSNINFQVVVAGIAYSPGFGPTYINYGQTAYYDNNAFSSKNTFAQATALVHIGESSFEAKVGLNEIYSIATSMALTPGTFASIAGNAVTGSQSPSHPNLTILPFTSLILSFDVITSTDISGAVPGTGAAVAGLRAHLGGQYIDVVSCKSSNPHGCDGLDGISSSAHIVWTLSTDSSPLSTILYFNTSATTGGISAVPEPTSALLLSAGILAILTSLRTNHRSRVDA